MKKSTIILLCSLVVLITASLIIYNVLIKDYKPNSLATAESSSQSEESEKILAPDFTVQNAQGDEVKLSDYLGKPIVLNFWASWCGPCKSEMGDFESVYKEQGEDIQFMMVNATDGTRETKEKAEAYITSQAYTMPIFFDIGQSAAYTYGISSLPRSFFIDKEGYVVATANGAIMTDDLKRGIELINK